MSIEETMLPHPLTPANASLVSFEFMPLHILRLQKSRAWSKCRRNPQLAFYMLNLWMEAWQSVPAGSINGDDDDIAEAAMCDDVTWVAQRENILRGWIKCSDGRLYHPFLCEIVNDVWGKSRKASKAAAQRWGKPDASNSDADASASAHNQDANAHPPHPHSDANAPKSDAPPNAPKKRASRLASERIEKPMQREERRREEKRSTPRPPLEPTQPSAPAGGGDDFRDVPPQPKTPAETIKQAEPTTLEKANALRDWAESQQISHRLVLSHPFVTWLEKGASPELIQSVVTDVLKTQRRNLEQPEWRPATVDYFNRKIVECIARGTAAQSSAMPPGAGVEMTEREQWEFRKEAWNSKGFWSSMWGFEPGEDGCQMPVDLLAECLPRDGRGLQKRANGS